MIADAIITTPQIIYVVVTLAGVIVTLVGGIRYLFRALITSKEREYEGLLKEKERDLRELENLWKSFRDIGSEAVKITTARENAFRHKEGLPDLQFVVPVVPEAFSPSTELSRANAEIATLRAQLAQLKLSAGIPAAPTPEAGSEKR